MKQFKRWLYAWIEQRFLDGCSNYNSVDIRRSCRTKQQARRRFAEHHVPHAQGKIFLWPWEAFRFVQQYGYPVVLKPNLGGYSRGSFFPIRNASELMSALIKVKLWWPKSVIEQYLRGRNYRVVVTRDGVDLAMRRYPPFVVGDGKSSIDELIDAENEIRRQMKLLPTIHEIPKDKRIKKFLKKQGMSLKTVPKMDEEVELYHRIALDPGGALENVDLVTIPQQNIQLFQKILDLFEANILGIDVIMEEGIEVPYDQQRCIFLEVNSRPYLKMHEYPRWGDRPDMESLYAKLDTLDIKDRDLY